MHTPGVIQVWNNRMKQRVNGGQKQQYKDTRKPLNVLKDWMQKKEKQLQQYPHHFFVPPVEHPKQPTVNSTDVVDASRLAIAAQHANENIGEKVVTKESVKKNVKNKKRQKQQNNPNKLQIPGNLKILFSETTPYWPWMHVCVE